MNITQELPGRNEVNESLNMVRSKEEALDYFDGNKEPGVVRMLISGPSTELIIKKVGEVSGVNGWDRLPIYEIWQEGLILGWANDRELAFSEISNEVREKYDLELKIKYMDKAA